jgi:hypothetical protein
MTIWKHEQTDGTGNWFLHLIARTFGIKCKSHIDGRQHGELKCRLLRWHKQKHRDLSGTDWCYGDEFFQ